MRKHANSILLPSCCAQTCPCLPCQPHHYHHHHFPATTSHVPNSNFPCACGSVRNFSHPDPAKCYCRYFPTKMFHVAAVLLAVLVGPWRCLTCACENCKNFERGSEKNKQANTNNSWILYLHLELLGIEELIFHARFWRLCVYWNFGQKVSKGTKDKKKTKRFLLKFSFLPFERSFHFNKCNSVGWAWEGLFFYFIFFQKNLSQCLKKNKHRNSHSGQRAFDGHDSLGLVFKIVLFGDAACAAASACCATVCGGGWWWWVLVDV